MSLTLIQGPMFSGKTGAMMEQVSRLRSGASLQSLIVQFKEDCGRYGVGIKTHDGVHMRTDHVTQVDSLSEIDSELLDRVQVVGIDEGQFYPDLVEYCLKWRTQGKYVIVSALSGDYRRIPFEVVSRLSSVAEKVIYRYAICGVEGCHCDAPYSRRFHLSPVASAESDAEPGTEPEAESPRIIIGGSERYQPVCFKHYTDGEEVSPEPPSPEGSDS